MKINIRGTRLALGVLFCLSVDCVFFAEAQAPQKPVPQKRP